MGICRDNNFSGGLTSDGLISDGLLLKISRLVFQLEIKVNGQKLETVTSFKYLGSVITDEGSKPEILSRIALTTAALARLKPVQNDRSISLSSKI